MNMLTVGATVQYEVHSYEEGKVIDTASHGRILVQRPGGTTFDWHVLSDDSRVKCDHIVDEDKNWTCLNLAHFRRQIGIINTTNTFYCMEHAKEHGLSYVPPSWKVTTPKHALHDAVVAAVIMRNKLEEV